jgi:hypothetical protein
MLEDGARIAQALDTALIGFLLEGRALEAPGLGPSHELSPYVERYGQEMERIGWTPKIFHDDYPVRSASRSSGSAPGVSTSSGTNSPRSTTSVCHHETDPALDRR